MVGDRDQRRRRPVQLEAAGGVGDQQRLAAEALERVDRDAHGGGVAALVIMAAALEERDPLAFDRADDEPPGMALDARDGKARQFRIGELDRVLRFLGERPEARAEHDAERRQAVEAVLLERDDRASDVLVHAAAPYP